MKERTNGELWIPAEKVEFLFGRIGEVANLGGAKVCLQKQGQGPLRKLELYGSQIALGRAASQIVVNLWEHANEDEADDMKVWLYETADRTQHGPFTWKQIENWARKGLLVQRSSKLNKQTAWNLVMEHTLARCRLELWLALAMHNVVLEDNDPPRPKNGELGDYDMAQSDILEAQLKDARKQWETQAEDMEIDEELKMLETVSMDFLLENPAHLYIVVDTNILMSYKAFLERMLELVTSENMLSLKQLAGLPAFKVVIVVPYMVLVELDYIKNKKGGFVELAKQAAFAIRMLEREKKNPERLYVGESFADFKAARKEHGDVDLKPTNDDRILFCAMACAKRAESDHKVSNAVILFSDDANLCLKASEHQIKAIRPREAPRTAEALLSLRVPDLSRPALPGPPGIAGITGTHTTVREPDYTEGTPSSSSVIISPFGRAASTTLVDDSIANASRDGPSRGDSFSRLASGSLRGVPSDREAGTSLLDDPDMRLELLVDDIQTIVEGPLATITQYLLQTELMDNWEEVSSAKVPWTAQQVLEVLDNTFNSVVRDHECVMNKRTLGDAIRGKSTPLRDTFRLRTRGPSAQLHSLLPVAAESLVSILKSFQAPRSSNPDPPEDVPKRIAAHLYTEALTTGQVMADKILTASLQLGMWTHRVGSHNANVGAMQQLSIHTNSAGVKGPRPYTNLPSRSSGPQHSPHAGYDAAAIEFGAHPQHHQVVQQQGVSVAHHIYEQRMRGQGAFHGLVPNQIVPGNFGVGAYAVTGGGGDSLSPALPALQPRWSGSSDTAYPINMGLSGVGVPAAPVAATSRLPPYSSDLLQGKLVQLHKLLESQYETVIGQKGSAEHQGHSERLAQLCGEGAENLLASHNTFVQALKVSDTAAMIASVQVLNSCLEQLIHSLGGMANLNPLPHQEVILYVQSVEKEGDSIRRTAVLLDRMREQVQLTMIAGSRNGFP
eukprot:jgi/Botrbrau1/13648/Bobra.0373s0020.2